MNPEYRPLFSGDFKQKVECAVERAASAYYATDPKSIKRLERIIQVEDNQKFANFMGVPIIDIVRAHLRGTPKQYQQDYLETIYDYGVLDGKESKKIASEFKLLPPTLIATSLSWSPFQRI